LISRRGRWKCPLYYGPTDSNITVEQIRDLEPIAGAWIYLRIAFQDDEVFGKNKSLYPENAMVLFKIIKFMNLIIYIG